MFVTAAEVKLVGSVHKNLKKWCVVKSHQMSAHIYLPLHLFTLDGKCVNQNKVFYSCVYADYSYYSTIFIEKK